MKISTSIFVLLSGLVLTAKAQTTVTDSIQTGPSYGNDVYYSLANGQVKTTSTSEWNLALGIGTFNVAIRANTAGNNALVGQTLIYEKPGKDTTQWGTFDTTGYNTWAKLDNSDEDWEMGALNQSSTEQFDYGWGQYNSSTHVITGHRLYFAIVDTGASNLYKKIWVVNKTLGVWKIKIANVDGSDEKTITVASSTYSTKNFVYLSLVTGDVIDREPAKTDWDFVLTRYNAYQPVQQVYYPSVGILTNMGVTSSEVRNKANSATVLADTVPFSSNISIIGADWKQLNMSTFAFDVVDSLTYFVKNANNEYWKLVFTKFLSGSNATTGTGRAVFNKLDVTPAVGLLNKAAAVNNLVIYPNPANSNISVSFNTVAPTSTVSIMDLSGRLVLQQQATEGNLNINVSAISKGLYLLQVVNGNNVSTKKISIN